MDRDKAVEEALRVIGVRVQCGCERCNGTHVQFSGVLNLLWQRAQEAEREECAKIADERRALSGSAVETFAYRETARLIRNRSATRAEAE